MDTLRTTIGYKKSIQKFNHTIQLNDLPRLINMLDPRLAGIDIIISDYHDFHPTECMPRPGK